MPGYLTRGGTGLIRLGAALLALLTVAAPPAARAEVKEVHLAEEFGVSYLPLLIMREQHLLESEAKAAGLGEIKVTWARFGGGPEMNDAILSGRLDFASGGVAPMITLWSRTKGRVKAVCALNSMPLYLNTTNPAVKTIRDFTDKDRIALPAVKVSIQAVTLQMAAAEVFGPDQANKLDHLTVSMKHPDGVVALLSGHSEITAHFTSPPFMYQELEDKRVHRVLDSYDVLGGPSTFNVVWTSQKFHDENPKLYAAFVSALKAADEVIAKDPKQAAKIYINGENSKLPLALIEKILRDPENRFTLAPQNTMKYAAFMQKIGMIPEAPKKWSDMFFPEAASLPGS